MDAVITAFATLLGTGVIVANALKKHRLPDTFFLLLAGLLFSPTLFSLVNVGAMGDIPDFLRLFALIIIVFAGSFNLPLNEFRQVSEIAIKLAFVGVFATTLLLGYFAHVLLGLDWVAAMLLGAIVSGTSLEALPLIEKQFSGEAMDILKVESIANSQLCVLLPLLFLDFYTKAAVPTAYLSKFWLMLAGGVGTGVIIGFLAGKVLQTAEREFSPLFSASIALVSYALAANVGGSGILAVAVAGLIAGNLTYPNKKIIRHFEDTLSDMLRISVFMLLGASVALALPTLRELAFLLVALFAVRPFAVLLSYLGHKELPGKEFLALSLIAPRGIETAAIAPLVLAYNLAGAGTIMNMAFLVVLASVLTSSLAAEYFRLSGPEEPAEYSSPE